MSENNEHQAKKARTFEHTSEDQLKAMLQWIENEANLKLVTGAAVSNAPVVAGRPTTRTDGFRMMANYVNQRCKGSNWTPEMARQRFGNYKKKYITANNMANKTGFGVTEVDRQLGVSTIDAKLDQMCPFYARLNALFGQKENVNPSYRRNSMDYGAVEDIETENTEAASEVIANDDETNGREEIAVNEQRVEGASEEDAQSVTLETAVVDVVGEDGNAGKRTCNQKSTARSPTDEDFKTPKGKQPTKTSLVSVYMEGEIFKREATNKRIDAELSVEKRKLELETRKQDFEERRYEAQRKLEETKTSTSVMIEFLKANKTLDEAREWLATFRQ
jgi:hypothetical protein